jgi:predicted ATPase
MATAPNNKVTTDTDERTKPPFLRRMRIRGYKSIAFCDVELQPLTILVGRNASGKSNFVDALAFLRDVLDEGANSALQEHGGASIFSQVTNTNRISFEVECDFPSYQMLCRSLYRVELALTVHKQIEIEQESLQLDDLTHGQRCGFRAGRGGVTWQGLDSFGEGGYRRIAAEHDLTNGGEPGYPTLFDQYRPDRPLLSVVGSQPFVDLAEGMRSIGCFNFHPESIRKLQPSIGSPALERDGRNLPRAIEGLKEIEEDDLSRVKSYLAAIIPEIEGFDVVQLGDFETIRFRQRTESGMSPLEFYASSMSDGTLRTLAALVAAFQIVLPYGYPSLVAIEEPETSLHPAAMRALVDALDEATGRTQILLTTHSAEMLDNPTIRPENVRVVQMIDSQTVIGPVDAASVNIVRRQLSTLGGLERDNQLEPDLDDRERQQRLAQSGQESPA